MSIRDDPINIYDKDMLYEDYKAGTYSDRKNRLKWKSTTPKDFILTSTNDCLEYRYYGNHLSVSNPGILVDVYIKPSKYILEVDARILPMNNIYNDAFLYRRIVTKNNINHRISDFKQKSKYKITPNTFSKIKMEFELKYHYDELESNDKYKGWSVLQCGIIFNDPKNMLKHGHIEIRNICLMDIGACQQAELPATNLYNALEMFPNKIIQPSSLDLETKLVNLETKLVELDSKFTYDIETLNKKIDALINSDMDTFDNIWDLLYDTEGNLYYLNKSTDESAWELPEGGRIRNKKRIPPLPPRSTSPITISAAAEEEDEELSNHFDNNDVPNLFTLSAKPKSRQSTDFLSDNTHAKVHPSLSTIMSSSMRLTDVDVYEPPSPTKSFSPKKTNKPNEFSYEDQIRRAMIESMASG